jgi:hypothetical protein
MNIARGLMSEDDYLLSEILFNPHTPDQLAHIRKELANLLTIIENRDTASMKGFLQGIREKIG